jgi:hypothetical protein
MLAHRGGRGASLKALPQASRKSLGVIIFGLFLCPAWRGVRRDCHPNSCRLSLKGQNPAHIVEIMGVEYTKTSIGDYHPRQRRCKLKFPLPEVKPCNSIESATVNALLAFAIKGAKARGLSPSKTMAITNAILENPKKFLALI